MIHLILGGARSGKSRFAVERVGGCVTQGAECLFIATAEALDKEMAARIARHRSEREQDALPWQTLECPLDLTACLVANARAGRVILVDCLTLWLTNQLLVQEQTWFEAKQALLQALPGLPGDILLVSNEVGTGVVPADPLSRRFVDEAGWLHQGIAALADEVTLVTAGLPLTLKGQAMMGRDR